MSAAMATQALSLNAPVLALDSNGSLYSAGSVGALGALPPRVGLGSSFTSSFKDLSADTSGDTQQIKDGRFVLVIKATAANHGSDFMESAGPLRKMAKGITDFIREPNQFLQLGQAAAGVAAAVAGANVGTTLLSGLDALPVLPQVEMVVGTMVTANFALQYLRGGEGRERIEAFFHDLREKVLGLDDKKGRATAAVSSEPFETQLVSVIDETLQSQQIVSSEGKVQEVALVADKQSFMAALKNFIDRREAEARKVTRTMEGDLATLATTVSKEKARTMELEQILKQQKRKAAKLKQLTSTLEDEKSKSMVEMTRLRSKMAGLEMEVASLRGEQYRLKQSNGEVQVVDPENAAKLSKLRSQMLELETELAVLRGERFHAEKFNKEEDTVVTTRLRSRMEGLETEVAALRGERFRLEKVKDELETKVYDGIEEREKLGLTVTALVEGKAKQEVDPKLLALRSQEESLKRETEEREARVAWLEEQMERTRAFAMEVTLSVEELSSEKKEREAHIVWLEQCLSNSESKSAVSEKQITSLQTQLKEVLEDSVAKKEAFQQEVATLKASLEHAEGRVHAAELRAAQAVKASKFAQAQVAVISAELHNKVVRVEAKRWEPLRVVEYEVDDEASREKMNERELEAYAALVKSGYLDIEKPSREQLPAVEALVQALVKKGASEGWARRHVLNCHAYDRRKVVTWGRGDSLGQVFTRVLG